MSSFGILSWINIAEGRSSDVLKTGPYERHTLCPFFWSHILSSNMLTVLERQVLNNGGHAAQVTSVFENIKSKPKGTGEV